MIYENDTSTWQPLEYLSEYSVCEAIVYCHYLSHIHTNTSQSLFNFRLDNVCLTSRASNEGRRVNRNLIQRRVPIDCTVCRRFALIDYRYFGNLYRAIAIATRCILCFVVRLSLRSEFTSSSSRRFLLARM